METKNQNQHVFNSAKRISNSTTFRMLVIGFLTLILMIPMSFINDLITERKHRKTDMIYQINKDWGGDTGIYGVILKIPYKTYVTRTYYDSHNKKHEEVTFDRYKYLYIFPDSMQLSGNLYAIPKHRGIFKTTVYKAQTRLTGQFAYPDFKSFNIDPSDVDWDKATLLFKTTNNKGILDRMKVKLGKRTYDFYLQGKDVDDVLYKKFETKALQKNPFSQSKYLSFEMNYNVKGSQSFYVIPLASTTEVALKSNWKDPKFTGYFLPDNDKKISDDKKSFEAHWKIIDYQRPFQKAYKNVLPKIDEYAFGVELLVMVDDYLKSERSAKYAYLVIFLTFLIFFIIQYVGKVEIHFFNYFLIGMALVIFYTLLVSVSEHINFNVSYAIASVATVLLIGLYAGSILNSKKFMGYIFSALSVLYLYIFVIIQLENYALLAGSIGLFVILALIMYASRKIKW